MRIIPSIKQLKFSELMEVYEESNRWNGKERYPSLSLSEQLHEAEQDFYNYLRNVFFRQEHSFYAIWEADGLYCSALRIEPFRNGYLLCALETAQSSRNRGNACALILATQNYLAQKGSGILYSHISKRNSASICVHEKCGFQIISDSAVYSDGSVHSDSYTLAYIY